MAARSPPRVFLVDDDPGVLTALGRLLTGAGYSVEPHKSAESFLDGHDPRVSGCAVVDLNLPGMSGLDLQTTLCERMAERPVIFLSGRGDISSSVKAMKAGAVDFLTKPVDAEAFLGAVSDALRKDEQSREKGEQHRLVEQRLATLTPRERQVMTQVVAGRMNKQIAADLGTVEKTVKVHRGRIMEKLGVRTIADVVRLVTLHQH